MEFFVSYIFSSYCFVISNKYCTLIINSVTFRWLNSFWVINSVSIARQQTLELFTRMITMTSQYSSCFLSQFLNAGFRCFSSQSDSWKIKRKSGFLPPFNRSKVSLKLAEKNVSTLLMIGSHHCTNQFFQIYVKTKKYNIKAP